MGLLGGGAGLPALRCCVQWLAVRRVQCPETPTALWFGCRLASVWLPWARHMAISTLGLDIDDVSGFEVGVRWDV